MASRDSRWAPWAVVLFAAAAGFGSACSPHGGLTENGLHQLEAESPLEFECERELVFLDSLIETRRADRRFSAIALAEAIELRRTASDLFLDGEYQLALELIDEAISLLKGAE